MDGLTDWPWQYWARYRPEQIALRVDDVAWRWHDLAQHCDALAGQFAQQGVERDTLVALRGKNSADMLLCYLALFQCGARVLPVNPQLPEQLISTLLPQLRVSFLLDLSSAPTLINGGDSAALRVLHFAALPADAEDAPSATMIPWDTQRIATLTLTSGSSGLPKAAAHAFSAHLASARGVIALMNYRPQDSWLLSLPLFHVSGQGIVWRWLCAGATLVIRAEQSLEQALRGCSHASLVPTQLWRLLAQGAIPDSLHAVLLGGAMIPLELTQQAEAQGIRCWCGYGLTEMASTVCAKRADGHPGVGIPLSQREICAVDGEILLRGACLAAGYWRDGTLIPLTDQDGWFHTRDSGLFQHDEWQVLGRLDNQFFSGGEGVQPENIEAILLSHPAVQQACVVPVDDPEFGQRSVAVLEMTSSATLVEIEHWLAPQLAGFQRPVAYYLLPAALQGSGIKIPRQQVKLWVQSVYRADGASGP